MTLCTAWIRQEKDNKELVFATDSCLSGGERWESGVKLFELPRKDCIICFSGSTIRTYPLILNLINSLNYDKYASNPSYDLNELVHYLCEQFTDVLKNTDLNISELEKDIKSFPFDFLFGGWSWKDNNFRLWKIIYSFDAHALIPIVDYDNLVFSFIGDELDAAKNELEDELKKSNKLLSGVLDMEPLRVLVKMIRNPQMDSISGPVQVAKIYPPGQIEFFGVYYPSISNGRKTFLGRDVSKTNNPLVRFIDPDTGYITDLEVPNSLIGIDVDIFGLDKDFIVNCYDEKLNIKNEITTKQRDILKAIFREYAYKEYLIRISKNNISLGNENE